jgi:hypothetical protein
MKENVAILKNRVISVYEPDKTEHVSTEIKNEQIRPLNKTSN